MSVNLLDVIILIPLLLWAYQGYKKGFIISLASLVALIAGLFFAFYFSYYTADKLKDFFDINEKYLAVISFIVTFIVVLLAVILVGNLLQKLIDILLLGFLNRAAGLVFGILKGALLLSILIFVINYFDDGKSIIKQEYRDGSLLYEPVESVAPYLYSLLHLDNLEIPTKEEIMGTV